MAKHLIQDCLSGDQQAFAKLCQEHQKYAFSVALKVINNEEDALEIVQDSFVRVWKNLKNYDSRMKFTTWLYKIVVNLCIDKYRKNKHLPLYTEILPDILTEPMDPEKTLTNKELIETIKALSNQLTLKQKIVFVLSDLEELEPTEIELITGQTRGQIKSNLYYARKSIKEKIEKLM